MSKPSEVLDPKDVDLIIQDVISELDIVDFKDLLSLVQGPIIGRASELVRNIVKNIAYTLLVGHPIFGAITFAIEASEYILNYLNVEITIEGSKVSVRTDVDERYWEDIKRDFTGWKNAIVRFRESINAQIIDRYAKRNSYYVGKLYREYGVNIFIPRLEFQEKRGQFIYLLEHGNVGADWSEVEYGGISLVKYQGIRFAETIAETIGPVVEGLFEVFKDSIVVKNKTKFFEDIEREASEEAARILEAAVIEFFETGKVDKGKYIVEFRKRFYEIYVTKAGRLGLRYSLKFNLGRGTREG